MNLPVDAAARGRRDLVRREAIASVIINAGMSVLFFLLVFGWQPATGRSLAIDCLPQTVGITFLGGLVPALLTLRKVAAGRVIAAGPLLSPGALAMRVLICATVAMVVLGGCAALLLARFAPPQLDPLPALIIKALFGSLVGLITTPPILRMTLGLGLFDRPFH